MSARPGAKVLMLGDAVVASKIDPGEYTIMKISHHGSGHNNYLTARDNRMSDAKIKISDGVLKNAVRFFYFVRAKKYVISASPSEGSPNPHVTTILGIYIAIVEACIPGRNRPPPPNTPVDVYLTNKFPTNTLQGFGSFLFNPDDTQYTSLRDENQVEYALPPGQNSRDIISRLDFNNFDTYMRIWLLKPDVPYGTIPIYDQDPPTSQWMRYTTNDFLASAAQTLVSKQTSSTTAPANSGPTPSKRRRKS
ncbi:hypothetical protein M378DRAFT_395549 [Amanita muscaria Koide BX008]|uniref:Uncharacterized protein n=1 Tax=Amanita muscaria (strain Koide BX008) TaxID=946122 RepID=A0A0C2S3R9_AMAMK|nr:hypothetical protein M378DRAFT_395549 [Amanita muscaria Koide BX008]